MPPARVLPSSGQRRQPVAVEEEEKEQEEEERERAATKIQAGARGRRERQLVKAKREKINERHQAATRIQASARGRQSRGYVHAKKEEVTSAAVKVQTSMRGKKARDGVKVKVEARAQDAWDLLLWVKGAQVHKAVAAAMQTAMAAEGVDGRKGEVAQEWVRSLPSRSALSSVIRTDALLDSLVDTVWNQIEALKAGFDTSTAAGPSSSAGTYSKFVAEGIGFKLNFGNLSTFFGGLEAKIGSPDPMVFDAMQREHQFSSDSRDFFTTGNYGVTTTPFIEWNFVAAPHDPPEPEGGWPVEARLQTGRPEDADRMRRALTRAELTRRRERISSKLRALGESELIVEEVIGGRQYTGPVRTHCEHVHTHML